MHSKYNFEQTIMLI